MGMHPRVTENLWRQIFNCAKVRLILVLAFFISAPFGRHSSFPPLSHGGVAICAKRNPRLWVKELLGINPNKTLKKSHFIMPSLCIWDPAQGLICSL